jgi:hypothetical protein
MLEEGTLFRVIFWNWFPPLRRQFAKVKEEALGHGA